MVRLNNSSRESVHRTIALSLGAHHGICAHGITRGVAGRGCVERSQVQLLHREARPCGLRLPKQPFDGLSPLLWRKTAALGSACARRGAGASGRAKGEPARCARNKDQRSIQPPTPRHPPDPQRGRGLGEGALKPTQSGPRAPHLEQQRAEGDGWLGR